ncbi:hypothetical protein K505DRAFT_360543 [Melanomma pulvis-pyrius CBS 109.77]|uniref:Uncharacterized protein n=1 Tax=Melanomma pulvis-pyrius CBS 109.77 TaxID=1314802 RepID=A0A6A6XHD1_9PLEO|nr:hypothetical protein K505DRAFT_360543 [Melanomma pulvis-pyrius CBS 109.77]
MVDALRSQSGQTVIEEGRMEAMPNRSSSSSMYDEKDSKKLAAELRKSGGLNWLFCFDTQATRVIVELVNLTNDDVLRFTGAKETAERTHDAQHSSVARITAAIATLNQPIVTNDQRKAFVEKKSLELTLIIADGCLAVREQGAEVVNSRKHHEICEVIAMKKKIIDSAMVLHGRVVSQMWSQVHSQRSVKKIVQELDRKYPRVFGGSINKLI